MSRLRKIYSPEKSTSTAIVFVHGLNGDCEETWTSIRGSERWLWIKQLGLDSEVSVWSFSYDAQMSNWIGDMLPIEHTADLLLEHLANEAEIQGRNLIMVGHSMGGLIVKQAVVSALTKSDQSHLLIVQSIGSIVFLATPHLGSELVNLALALGASSRINPSIKALTKNDSRLRNLHQQFLAIQDSHRFMVHSFVEGYGIFIGKYIWGLRIGKRIIVVTPDSADLLLPGAKSILTEEDHFSIAKPASNESLIYRRLLAIVNETEANKHPSYTLGKGKQKYTISSSNLANIVDEFSTAMGTDSFGSDIRTLSDSRHFPHEMLLNGRPVPNPIWTENPSIATIASMKVTDRMVANMLLAVREMPQERPQILCYWSKMWQCYLFPFQRLQYPYVSNEQQQDNLRKHAKTVFRGSVIDTKNRMLSAKPNREFKGEVWLYAYSFHNLVLPSDFITPEGMRWLTMEHLIDERNPERSLNGDVLRAIRNYFSMDLHDLERSDIHISKWKND